MARPLFSPGPRLLLCAGLLRTGKPLIDVGTDHAYLPIWLLRSGKIPRGTASDVNPGPLEAARKNAEKYGVEDGLRLVLSDGLRELSPEDGDDIVIAGMGGELILRIVTETEWLRDGEKLLVLQPMSSVPELRTGLAEAGFAAVREEAAVDAGKVYSAFSVRYIGKKPETDRFYPYLGKLEPGAPGVEAYAEKVLRELSNRLAGALHNGETAAAEELEAMTEAIRRKFLKRF